VRVFLNACKIVGEAVGVLSNDFKILGEAVGVLSNDFEVIGKQIECLKDRNFVGARQAKRSFATETVVRLRFECFGMTSKSRGRQAKRLETISKSLRGSLSATGRSENSSPPRR
jgi:hypothetical protein